MTFDEKWPVMVVAGAPIPIDLAGEVVRRTDTFFTDLTGPHGANREYEESMIRRMRLPDRGDSARSAREPGSLYRYVERIQNWQRRWGAICTQHVRNEWISACGTPTGWCRPDGQLSCTVRIGKYPGESTVLDDWTRIAKAFPQLDLVASVFHDDEVADPSYSVIVRGGAVQIVRPGRAALHERFGDIPPLAEREAWNAEIEQASRENNFERFRGRAYSFFNATLPPSWVSAWEIVAAQVADPIDAEARDVAALIEEVDRLSAAGDVDRAIAVAGDHIRAWQDRCDNARIDKFLLEIRVDRVDGRIVDHVLASTDQIAGIRNREFLRDLRRHRLVAPTPAIR